MVQSRDLLEQRTGEMKVLFFSSDFHEHLENHKKRWLIIMFPIHMAIWVGTTCLHNDYDSDCLFRLKTVLKVPDGPGNGGNTPNNRCGLQLATPWQLVHRDDVWGVSTPSQMPLGDTSQ